MLDVLSALQGGLHLKTRPKGSRHRREVIRECLTNNIFDTDLIVAELKKRGLHGGILSTSVQAMVSRECRLLGIYRPKSLIYFGISNGKVFTEAEREKALQVCQDAFEKGGTIIQVVNMLKDHGLWISYEYNRGMVKRAKVRYLKTGYVSKEMEDSK